MIVNFNTFKEFEIPLLRLCNADDSYICNINNPTEFKGEYNFSEFSVISFRIDYMTDRYCYDNIAVKKEIYLGKSKEDQKKEAGLPVQDFEESSEDCGYFVITDVAETKNLTERYKTITAKSCEFELSGIEMPYIGENDGFNTFGSRVLFHELDFAKDIDEFPGYTPDNAPCVMRTIIDYIPGWIVKADSDFIDPSSDKATLPTRTFETDDKDTIYGFLMSNAAEAFNCVFLFDVFNRIIYIKSQRDAISGTDIYLSSDDFLESITIKESEEDRINAVQVSGSDAVSISSVNPLGNNYIYKFNDKYDRSVMSPALWSIVSDWCDKYETDVSTYTQYMKQIYSLNAQISTLSTVRMSLDNKKNIASSEKTQTDAMLTYSQEMETKKAEELGYYTAIINEYDRQVSALDSKIGNINDSTNSTLYGRYNSYSSLVDNIIQGLDFYNYIYNHPSVNENENTAAKLYTELVRLFRVYSYSNTNIVMSDAVKNIPMVEQFEAVGRYDYENDTSSTISQKVTTYANGFNTWINTTVANWVTNTVEPQVDKQFDVIQELYDDAIGILSRTSQPRCEITIDSTNFIFSEEFKHKAEQIKTGCSIHIEKPNGEIVKHYVLKINVDYSGKDFSITLSNRYRLNDALSIFEDSYGNTSSISAITNSHSIILEEQKRKIDALDVARLQSLNYTKQHILSADNQDIFVDDTGMIVRTVTSVDENGVKTYDPYQFKLANGSILFTEDSWQTAGLAVGKYYDPRIGSWRMGINGQHIMANTIEASSLTVGSLPSVSSNTSGTNLLRDGSFDEDMQGEIEENGKNAWMLYGATGNYDPRRTETRNLIYGKGTPKKNYETTISIVRLGMGTSMKRNIEIPAYASDKEWHLCVFLRGQIKVSAKLYNPNSSNNMTLKGSISNSMFNYVNTSGETEYVKNMGCVELLNVSNLVDGNASIEIEIMYDNEQTTNLNYAELSSIFITDRFGSVCNLDENTSGSDYAKNHCHNFTMFPDRFWTMQTVGTTGRSKLSSLPVEYVSSTDACNGVCIQDNKNYILIGTKDIALTNKTDYTYSISVTGNNGSSVLVNSYLVKKSMMTDINDPSKNIDLGDYLDGNYGGNVLQQFSTYIDLKGTQETGYDEITFGAGSNYTDVCLICLISANVSSGRKIYIKSVCIRQAGTELNSIKEIRMNPWCNKPSASFLYFSYELLQQEKTGGFDDGAFVSMPPGTGLTQREKFVVFEGLPYYISCYAKGHFDMTISFYYEKDDTQPIMDEDNQPISYTFSSAKPILNWERISCDTPIIAPEGAKYANIILNATEDEYYIGCQVDGALFEQSTVLNAYQTNDNELFAAYTTINSEGVSVYGGKIRIYNDAKELVFSGDQYGNLEIVGKITSTTGNIGGWDINTKSLSSPKIENSDGTYYYKAIIDPDEGSFASMADDTTLTKLSSGYLNFENNNTKGYIGFAGSVLSIGSDNTVRIMKKGNMIAEFGGANDTICINQPIRNTCKFENGLSSDDDIISYGRVYSGGYDWSNEVVTYGDYNILVEDVDALRGAVSALASAVENANVDVPDGNAGQGGTGGSDDSGTQTIVYNWGELYKQMKRHIGDTSASMNPGMADCYSYAAAHDEYTTYSYSNFGYNKEQAYLDWAGTCGFDVTYRYS